VLESHSNQLGRKRRAVSLAEARLPQPVHQLLHPVVQVLHTIQVSHDRNRVMLNADRLFRSRVGAVSFPGGASPRTFGDELLDEVMERMPLKERSQRRDQVFVDLCTGIQLHAHQPGQILLIEERGQSNE